MDLQLVVFTQSLLMIFIDSLWLSDTPLEDKTCFGVCLVRLLGQDAKIHGVESTLADVDSLHELTYSMRFKVSYLHIFLQL